MAVSNILTGWTNFTLDFFDLLPLKVKVEATKRLKICDTCIVRTNNKCDKHKKGINIETGQEVNGCHCNLSAKTLDPNSSCPLAKWKNYQL